MNPIAAELIAVTVAAAVAGAVRLSAGRRLAAVVGLTIVAWVVRYHLILSGDTTFAEDYLNDLNGLVVSAELAAAFGWLGLVAAAVTFLRRRWSTL